MRRALLGLTVIAAGLALLAPPTAVAAPRVVRDLNYDLGTPPKPPATAAMNRLDLYMPRRASDRPRPIIVWVHGGGWRTGDKRRGIHKKALLFTRAGYVFASINYRLSAAPFEASAPNPDRVMFPAHPHDVGEAIGWLDRHAQLFGGDRRRIVVLGHSAGAHLAALVATDPTYLRRYGTPFRNLAGFVALDAPAYDIAAAADPDRSARPREGREMLWNAFGTPEENASSGYWAAGSPLASAGRNDPPALLVTQADNEQRLADHRAMATALGRDPDRVVLPVSLDHREIGRVLGDPGDPSSETVRVRSFVRRAVQRPRR